MNDLTELDIYRIVSDTSISGIIILILIVFLVYRKPIGEWLKCKKDTDEILDKVDKIVRVSEDSQRKFEKFEDIIKTIDVNKNIDELEKIKKEINTEIAFILNELRVIFSELRAENNFEKVNFYKIEDTVEKIEKKIDKLLKIAAKYLKSDDSNIND